MRKTNLKGMMTTMLDEFVLSDIVKTIVEATIKVVGGLIIVYLLFKIINIVNRKVLKKLENRFKADATVVSFLSPLIVKLLKFFIVVCYIGFIGIETSSIVAAITSAGLAVGLALQGSLSNFAGGFIILFMRPFKVGDYIEVCGESGFVENIEIFYTTLVTIDNQVIKIPNGQVASSTIVDDNTKSTRRVNLVFSIGHNNDYSRVKDIINECIEKTGLRLKNTSVFINIVGFNLTSVDITVRVWSRTKDYWDLYFMLQEGIKIAFDKEGIMMPSSKLEVKLEENNKSV